MKRVFCLSLVLLLITGFAGICFEGMALAASPFNPVDANFVGNGNIYFYNTSFQTIGTSTTGSLTYFEYPLGWEHFASNGSFPIWEGYTLCYGPTTGNENAAYDIYTVTSNIVLQPLPADPNCFSGPGPSLTYFSPDGNGCSNYPYSTNIATAPFVSNTKPLNLIYYTRTADNTLRIKNNIQWDGVNNFVTVTVTVKNISASPVVVAALKRDAKPWVDAGGVDGANVSLNWWGRTHGSIFGWNDPSDYPQGHRIELRASTTPTATTIASSPSLMEACPTPGSSTTVQGQYGMILEWDLGTIAPGATVSRTMTYR